MDHAGDTLVDLATNPAITTSGKYYDDKVPATTSERSYNVEEQEKLWEYSAKVVGL